MINLIQTTYPVKNMYRVVELFQNIVSKDTTTYPIFDESGYVHIVLWKTNDGRFWFHNSNKTKHKDRLLIDVKANIHDVFNVIFQHTHFDNLYCFTSRYLPNTIKMFVEITETHIRKSYIINRMDFDHFKRTYDCTSPPLPKSTFIKNGHV